MKIKPETSTTTKTTYRLKITDEMIRKAFKLPISAELAFHIPSGGSYFSDEPVEVEEIEATWVITKERENKSK
jgi:hypothetical protein